MRSILEIIVRLREAMDRVQSEVVADEMRAGNQDIWLQVENTYLVMIPQCHSQQSPLTTQRSLTSQEDDHSSDQWNKALETF